MDESAGGASAVPAPPSEPIGITAVMPSAKHALPRWVVPVMAALVVLLLGTAGVAVWALLRPSAPISRTPAAAAPPEVTPTNVVAPPPQPTYHDPTAKDLQLEIKTLEKSCFGSAGCNITFRILVTYAGPALDPSKTYEVTYEVKGGEDPLINTLELTGDQYRTDSEELISTTSQSAKLTAIVIEVSEA